MSIIYKGKTVANVGGSGGVTGAQDVYSTEEVRIGTWIDGRPLYRKVIEPTEFTIGTTRTYTTFFSTSGLNVVSCSGYFLIADARIPSNRQKVSVPFVDANAKCYISILEYEEAVGLVSEWNNSQTVIGGNIILEYTKTTDSAKEVPS